MISAGLISDTQSLYVGKESVVRNEPATRTI